MLFETTEDGQQEDRTWVSKKDTTQEYNYINKSSMNTFSPNITLLRRVRNIKAIQYRDETMWVGIFRGLNSLLGDSVSPYQVVIKEPTSL